MIVPDHVCKVQHFVCQSQDHLDECLTNVLSLNGEGLVCRKPTSLYTPGRSANMLKIKVIGLGIKCQRFLDSEVRVLSIDNNRLLCEQ